MGIQGKKNYPNEGMILSFPKEVVQVGERGVKT